MNGWDCLEGLKIGCVKYLNAQPLIAAYGGAVHFDHPSALAEQIRGAGLDAGLVPVFEAIRHRDYTLVDGVGICCDGPVFSVYLAHQRPVERVRCVSLDAASLTSVHLLKVLLKEYLGCSPRFLAPGEPGEADAKLLIGNQAIEYRMHAGEGWKFMDLGEQWKICTGLPFVFALWMLRKGLAEEDAVGEAFRDLKEAGVAKIPDLVEQGNFQDRDFRRLYLGGYIRYSFGEREKAGLELFTRLLARHGYVEPREVLFRFV